MFVLDLFIWPVRKQTPPISTVKALPQMAHFKLKDFLTEIILSCVEPAVVRASPKATSRMQRGCYDYTSKCKSGKWDTLWTCTGTFREQVHFKFIRPKVHMRCAIRDSGNIWSDLVKSFY